MTKARLEQIVKIVTVVATLVLVFVTVLSVSLYIKAGVLSSKSKSLDKEINKLSITRAEIEQGIELRNSDAYIEQRAREDLGMIKDDEMLYIFD